MTTTKGAGDEVIFDETRAGAGAAGAGVGRVGSGVRSNSVLRGLSEGGAESDPFTLFRRNQSITIFARPVDAAESDPATEVEVGNPALVEAEGFHAVPCTNGVASALGIFPVDFFVGVLFAPGVDGDVPAESRSKIGVGGAPNFGSFELVFLLNGWRLIAFCRRLFLLSFVTSSSAFAASPPPIFVATVIDPFSFSFVGVTSLSGGNDRLELDVGSGGG